MEVTPMTVRMMRWSWKRPRPWPRWRRRKPSKRDGSDVRLRSTKTWSSRAKGEIIPRVATAPTSTGPKIVDRVSGAVTAASGQWMRHLGVRKPSLSPRRLIATVPTVKLASPEPELPTAAPPIKRKKRPRPPPPMANIPRMPILI